MSFSDYVITGAMGVILITFFVFIIQKAVELFSNQGED